MKLIRSALIWVPVTACFLCLVAPAWASPDGDYAANQVSLTNYIDLMDNWLFTHDGDNRGPLGPDLAPARDNIATLMQSYGLSVTLEPFTYSGRTYHNVVGTLVGSQYPDQEWVIGAHYDSVSNPGADDNASGTALVLEAARVLGQYDSAYTIRFVAFSMEEVGLVGSSAYVNAHSGDDILGMISADMVAYDTGTDTARIYSRGAGSPIFSSLSTAVVEYGDGLAWMDAGWISASDHAPFDSAGYDACLLIEGEVWNNDNYHTQLDSFDTPGYLDFDYAVMMTRSIVGWLVDQADVWVLNDYLGFDYPMGQPEYLDPAGGTTLRVEISENGTEQIQPGTPALHYDDGMGWQVQPLTKIGSGIYDAVFPAADCGTEIRYYISAESAGGALYTDPYSAPAEVYSADAVAGSPAVIYEWDLSTDPGWSTQGQWAHGQPTGGGGEHGGPDPTSGYTGPDVYGYNLAGDYPNNLAETHLTSTAIDCTDLYGVHLKFWRWLGVEIPRWDHAYIRVSNDGVNFQTVWTNADEVADTEWTLVDLDISEFADNEPTVYLRWTMGTTDTAYRYCGWNIDDISIEAIDCAAAPGLITHGWSCLDHGPAGELCLNLDTVALESRMPGVSLLSFDVDREAASVSASVDCIGTAYSGAVNANATDMTVDVSFDPPLPDRDCCTVTLTGDVQDSFLVSTLAGDVDGNGVVSTADASAVKAQFGADAEDAGAEFDVDASGTVSTSDYSVIKPLFGNQSLSCP